MRWVVVGVFVSRAVGAQPSATPSSFEQCKAQRISLTRDAMKVSDVDERARMLLAMPICSREPDGTLEVTDPRAPPPPLPPFTPHASLALALGFAASLIGYQVRPATGYGPTVELEADWQPLRRLSVGGFAAYEGFDDGSYLGAYDVIHHFYDL